MSRTDAQNERTFLAWLRSSLSLVGVGVSITQLFRLKTSAPQYTPPTVRTHAFAQDVKSPQLSHDDVLAAFTQWLAESQMHNHAEYLHMVSAERTRTRRYHKLGKPLGTAFVAMGILFLMLGGMRYLSVQHHLVSTNSYAPPGKTILLAAFSIGLLTSIAFALILEA